MLDCGCTPKPGMKLSAVKLTTAFFHEGVSCPKKTKAVVVSSEPWGNYTVGMTIKLEERTGQALQSAWKCVCSCVGHQDS